MGEGVLADDLQAGWQLHAPQAGKAAESLLGNGPAPRRHRIGRPRHRQGQQLQAIAAIEADPIAAQEGARLVHLQGFQRAAVEGARSDGLGARADAQALEGGIVEYAPIQDGDASGKHQLLQAVAAAHPVGVVGGEVLGEGDAAQGLVAAEGARAHRHDAVRADDLLHGRLVGAGVSRQGHHGKPFDRRGQDKEPLGRLAALDAHLAAIKHDVAPRVALAVSPCPLLRGPSCLEVRSALQRGAALAQARLCLRGPLDRGGAVAAHGRRREVADARLQLAQVNAQAHAHVIPPDVRFLSALQKDQGHPLPSRSHPCRALPPSQKAPQGLSLRRRMGRRGSIGCLLRPVAPECSKEQPGHHS